MWSSTIWILNFPIHEHDVFLIYLGFSEFISMTLYGFKRTSFTSLLNLFLSYFIAFDATVNIFYFFCLSNQRLCLERPLIFTCRKTTDMCDNIRTLSNIVKPCWGSLSALRVLCVNFLGFLYTRSFICEQRNFSCFFNLMTFIYFSCLIALLRTFNMMLNKVAILVLYLSFRENLSVFHR